MDAGAFAVVQRWLDARERLPGVTARCPVFCTLDGQPMQTAYVRALLPRLAARAGITKRVHAHGLRHSHAADLAREGLEMPLISAQLGHRNIATTDRYLRHIQPTALLAAVRGRAWPVG
jgi:site-specific recombinase XerD